MTENEMINIQLEMQSKINLTDRLSLDSIQYVTGVDSSYFTISDKEYACCCAVTVDRFTHRIVEKKHEIGEVTVPYISGLLSFREEDITIRTLSKLKHETDVIIFDGNGVLHARKMGIATHVGILLDKVTIGVAKTFYNIGNIGMVEVGNKIGDTTDIIYDNYLYGKALRTHKDWKPVYISCGNNICLDSSVKLIQEFITNKSRIPLPTQLADIETHIERNNYINNLV